MVVTNYIDNLSGSKIGSSNLENVDLSSLELSRSNQATSLADLKPDQLVRMERRLQEDGELSFVVTHDSLLVFDLNSAFDAAVCKCGLYDNAIDAEFSPDGSKIAIVLESGVVQIFSLKSQNQQFDLEHELNFRLDESLASDPVRLTFIGEGNDMLCIKKRPPIFSSQGDAGEFSEVSVSQESHFYRLAV